jgi:hypothetical protein
VAEEREGRAGAVGEEAVREEAASEEAVSGQKGKSRSHTSRADARDRNKSRSL